jgi:hypothetical protein
MKKVLIILILFISCSHKEGKVISEVEICYVDKDIITIIAANCNNFTELFNTKKLVLKDSNLSEKLSRISFVNNDNENIVGDIRIKAFFHYSNNKVDTLCVSYVPPVMYLNSKTIKYNTELEQLLSYYIYR